MQVPIAGQVNPVTGPQKTGMREDKVRRQQARLQKPLWAVHIGENHFQEPRSLDQRRFKNLGLGRRDKQRNRVQLPGPIQAARVAIDVVRDAVFANELFGFFPAPAQLAQPQSAQGTDKGSPVWARLVAGTNHFIVGSGERSVTVRGSGMRGKIKRRW